MTASISKHLCCGPWTATDDVSQRRRLWRAGCGAEARRLNRTHRQQLSLKINHQMTWIWTLMTWKSLCLLWSSCLQASLEIATRWLANSPVYICCARLDVNTQPFLWEMRSWSKWINIYEYTLRTTPRIGKELLWENHYMQVLVETSCYCPQQTVVGYRQH